MKDERVSCCPSCGSDGYGFSDRAYLRYGGIVGRGKDSELCGDIDTVGARPNTATCDGCGLRKPLSFWRGETDEA